jgi:hypothetical protein
MLFLSLSFEVKEITDEFSGFITTETFIITLRSRDY